MKKYSRKSLENIQAIVQEKTGVAVATNGKSIGRAKHLALSAGCLLCFVTLCAFAYAKFSGLDGDDVGFASAYQGDGRFEIVVVNNSDRELRLQDNIKVMRWLTNEDVEGDNEKIEVSSLPIAPHSQGIVSIDLSKGYDWEEMEEKLQDGDWYYFLLTNNNFAFGQDWMCSFNFEEESIEDARRRLEAAYEQELREFETLVQEYRGGNLIHSDWVWPTVSRTVAAPYGERENGTYSDHINIAGTAGDEIYAVAGGIVKEISFESLHGNFIIVDLGDGIAVKYGHLQEIKVSEGDEVVKGQVIATLGQTGMATGPNLSFTVTVDGEEINPLVTR